MTDFRFTINPASTILKFQQLIDCVNDAISRNVLRAGDILPSVNQVCNENSLSRDTVFKAYAELKKRGIIESVPNRGYFISQATVKVFLFLDTFKAYKEVLYHSFRDNLPENVAVDLHFHHYNIDVFEKIVKESIGKYTKYIIMNFDHPRVKEITSLIPAQKLLIIDWIVNSDNEQSKVYQDFGQPVYDCLSENIGLIRKYEKFIYLYPEFTYHPPVSIDYFLKFVSDFSINHSVLKEFKKLDIQKGELYLLVSDRTLAKILDQCEQKGLVPGVDVGIISYNETPMKKYVKNGITVLSTDFERMGQKAAEFVSTGEKMNFCVSTRLKIRSSL
ncbi:MAG: GntR family transcriptional regulator [Prolixibacteraceae bacterium]|jgi:DNA-binding transcriptional regulator YhcF (GntR family)|nr:GntR family transcriptional regulator [Prolixibacteraceae bacterium]